MNPTAPMQRRKFGSLPPALNGSRYRKHAGAPVRRPALAPAQAIRSMQAYKGLACTALRARVLDHLEHGITSARSPSRHMPDSSRRRSRSEMKDGGETRRTFMPRTSRRRSNSNLLGPSAQLDFDGALANQLNDWFRAPSCQNSPISQADARVGL